MSINVDFKTLFEQSPNAYVLLTPHLFIAEANAAYLRATGSRLEEIVGKYGFHAFPHDPQNINNASVRQTKASLMRVLRTGLPDHIPFVHYRVPQQKGNDTLLVDHYWSITNTPIFTENGHAVAFILQHAVDVTELHTLQSQAVQANKNHSLGIEAQVYSRAQQVQQANMLLDYERRQLRSLFQQAPGIMASVTGPDHIFDMANAAYCKFVGRDDLIGKSVNDAMPEIAEQGFIRLLDQVYTTGEPFIANGLKILLQRRPDAALEETYVDFIYQPIFDAEGNVTGIFCEGHDVTAWKKAEENSRLWQRAIEAASNGIMIVDVEAHDQPIIYVNPSFERMTGYTSSELIGKNARLLQSHDTEQHALSEIRDALHEKRTAHVTLRNYRKNGELFWNELSIAPVDDASDQARYFIGIQNDITHRKQFEQQLEYLANYDDLTGLPNRNLMRDRLSKAMARAKRDSDMMAVCFLDLDRFKALNDTMGHEAGDELLYEIAKKLSATLRAGDTVARPGGDEFVVIAHPIPTQQEAAALANRILASFSNPFRVADQDVHVTCSLGIALYPPHGATMSDLLKHADSAMYCAKKKGRNTVCFYEPAMGQQAQKRFELEADMRHAVARKEWVLHYQPQIDLDAGEITGFEALLRWQHPKHGLLNPGDFIGLAEETGLIIEIGKWALHEACSQAKQWQSQGLGNYSIAVNLSARQFVDNNLLQSIEDALTESKLEAHYLELEITESLLMENPFGAAEMLNQLRSRGVRLSIDDFGTGYSSLGYLKRFALDTLKIDRTFVRDIATDADDAAIVTAIIAMAHQLKLQVVAEGVENAEQLYFLKKHRCDNAQGYYFSKPLSAEECVQLLKRQHRFSLCDSADENDRN